MPISPDNLAVLLDVLEDLTFQLRESAQKLYAAEYLLFEESEKRQGKNDLFERYIQIRNKVMDGRLGSESETFSETTARVLRALSKLRGRSPQSRKPHGG